MASSRPEVVAELGAEPVAVDAFEAEAVVDAVSEAKPDAIINLLTRIPHTAIPSPRRFEENNALRREGTANLLAGAAKAGVARFITESVTFAFGGRLEQKMRPLYGMGPFQDAVDAVVDMEEKVLAFEGSVLRYGYFYGPGTSINEKLPEAMKRRRFAVIGKGTGWISFVHIDDAADATILALDKAKPGEVYNICDDDPVLTRDAYAVIAFATGSPPPWRLPGVAPYWVVAHFNRGTGANNSKARHELQWEPKYPKFPEGFVRSVEQMGGASAG